MQGNKWKKVRANEENKSKVRIERIEGIKRRKQMKKGRKKKERNR